MEYEMDIIIKTKNNTTRKIFKFPCTSKIDDNDFDEAITFACIFLYENGVKGNLHEQLALSARIEMTRIDPMDVLYCEFEDTIGVFVSQFIFHKIPRLCTNAIKIGLFRLKEKYKIEDIALEFYVRIFMNHAKGWFDETDLQELLAVTKSEHVTEKIRRCYYLTNKRFNELRDLLKP
jgi:hypothetical protein